MRYQQAHAATSGSVPFALHGRKPARSALAAVVAGAIGLIPAVMVASPAQAAETYAWNPSSPTVDEGKELSVELGWSTDAADPVPTNLKWSTSTAGKTATSGTDFTAVADQPITFVAGKATLKVTTLPDTVYEGDETFDIIVKKVDASEAAKVSVKIVEDDLKPSYSLSASPTPVTEATGAKVRITATLSKASAVDTKIKLDTQAGSATSGVDYDALVAKEITIKAGDPSQYWDVDIKKDGTRDKYELETFSVNGTGDSNVSKADASVDVQIKDADPLPKLKLGGGGSKDEAAAIAFPVSIDIPSELDVKVQWNAVAPTKQQDGHGVATADEDFPYPSAAQRVLTISAGTTAPNPDLSVTPGDDNMNELDEDFAVELSNPVNAELGTPKIVDATIVDKDSADRPTVSILPASVMEGDSGSNAKTFTATLSKKSGRTVTVDWTTAPDADLVTVPTGHAIAGKDYTAKSGKLIFPAGVLEQTFTVNVTGDKIDEGAVVRSAKDGETFRIKLNAPQGDTSTTIANVYTDVTIEDDDAAPTLTFSDASYKEGDGPWASLVTLKLEGSSDQTLTIPLTDATSGNQGTATDARKVMTGTSEVGSDDYDLIGNSIVIQPESTTGYGVVLVNGDNVYEKSETIFLKADVTGAPSDDYITAPYAKTMKITLENDDKAPNLEINSVSGKEDETVDVMGTVTGWAQEDVTLSVLFQGKAVDGLKAASDKDFENPGVASVKIDGGTESGTKKHVAYVKLLKDYEAEPAEAIVAYGFGLNNVGSVTDGVIKIEANGKPEEPHEPGDKPSLKAKWAKLEGAGKAEVEGWAGSKKEVNLWGQEVGGGSLKWIKKVTSNDDGYFWFDHYIDQGFRFQVESAGKKSDEVTVWVTEKPYFVVSTSSKGQLNFGVKGNPWWEGQTAAVQEWTKSGWKTIRSGKIGKDGVYRASYGYKSGTKVTVRGWVEGNAGKGIYSAFSDDQMHTVK